MWPILHITGSWLHKAGYFYTKNVNTMKIHLEMAGDVVKDKFEAQPGDRVVLLTAATKPGVYPLLSSYRSDLDSQRLRTFMPQRRLDTPLSIAQAFGLDTLDAIGAVRLRIRARF